MTDLSDILSSATKAPGLWPRAVVSPDLWDLAASKMADGKWTLVAHWGEPGIVYLALRERGGGKTGIVSLDAQSGNSRRSADFACRRADLSRAIREIRPGARRGAPD